MVEYSTHELADMHLVYEEANRNSREARRSYHERFPNRRLPAHALFQRLDARLRETGSLLPRRWDCGRPRTVRTVQFEEDVLDAIRDRPDTSTRVIARTQQTHHSNVFRVLQEEGLHPYKLHKVHHILPTDFPLRMDFCQWYVQQTLSIPEFPTIVLWTDEAMFTRDGMFNSHNSHVWDMDNPHAIIVRHHQHRFAVNVWCGVVGDHLIGPYILPSTLCGGNYRVFLHDVLPELLENVPLAGRQRIWFQHDGAPAHFDRGARALLNDIFGDRWIGRGEPLPWPPRSPDLTPLDFFVWGEMKRLVYETPVESAEDLVARVSAAAGTIGDMPEVFARTRQSVLRRCHLCLEVNGGHFQQRL